MTWDTIAGAGAGGPARRALAAWATLVRAVRSDASGNRLDDARLAVASVLLPSRASQARSFAATQFAEQMTADVSMLREDQRTLALAELGPTALAFVLAVWVCDIGTRARAALMELFGDPLLDDLMSVGSSDSESAWSAHQEFLREVAKLITLDPVTAELVRLRGARAHGCRLCQSLRSRTAVLSVGGKETFDTLDTVGAPDLTERHKAALGLVDAFIWTPMAWPGGLADDVRDLFSPDETIELVLDLMRNSANKIAVALAADAPHVDEGIEYYDIDFSSGDLLYGLTPI